MPTLEGGRLKAERAAMVATPNQIAKAAKDAGLITMPVARAYIKNRDLPQVVLDQINADASLTAAEKDEMLLELELANTVRRSSPLFTYLQAAFGVSDEVADDLMRAAMAV